MAKSTFQEYICRPFCAFFKAGQKEEMTCRGAEVAERLVAEGRVDTALMPSLRKAPDLWKRHRESLGIRVCRMCPFFQEDCDFQAAELVDDAEPCGGFILLAHWCESNLVQEADLE